jgi:hypothetical protein
MIGYILTQEQKEQIQGQEFAPFEHFNCVQDINNVWFNFVTEQQKPLVESSEYAWILNLPELANTCTYHQHPTHLYETTNNL